MLHVIDETKRLGLTAQRNAIQKFLHPGWLVKLLISFLILFSPHLYFNTKSYNYIWTVSNINADALRTHSSRQCRFSVF